ncbi:MAG: hypothetical protein QM541_01405 [Flavobacterium sp.]|nr:hypothetical protein [Flavobacterium sp.]
MALSLCILLILLLSSSHGYSQSFKIAKIDSTTNYYLVSISEGDSNKGIIVSKKKVVKGNRKANTKIETGQMYRLDLEKYRLLKFINRTSFETETSGKGGIAIDGVVVWKPSDGYGLYETADLQGLLYAKK